MTEATLVKKMVRAAKRKYGDRLHMIKIHGGPHQIRGVSDVIFCLDGYYGALEVKRPGKEANISAHQEAFLRKVAKAGGTTGLVTTVPQVLKILRQVEKKAKV